MANTKKNEIRYINDTTAQVTKAFAKKAVIFGTDEFKLWRKYLKEFPGAKMVTKTIKKDPDKKTRRNLTYKNMIEYIKTQPQKESEKLLAEFETIKSRSKIQASPYQYVLSWFEGKFEGYNDLKQFVSEKEAERKAKEAEKEAERKAKEAENAASAKENTD